MTDIIDVALAEMAAVVLRDLADGYGNDDHPEAIVLRAAANLAVVRACDLVAERAKGTTE